MLHGTVRYPLSDYTPVSPHQEIYRCREGFRVGNRKKSLPQHCGRLPGRSASLQMAQGTLFNEYRLTVHSPPQCRRLSPLAGQLVVQLTPLGLLEVDASVDLAQLGHKARYLP